MRVINQKKIVEMKIKIRDMDWSYVLHIEDLNQSIALFYSKFNQIFDRACPLVLRKSQGLPRKPSVTQILLNSIRKKKK